jgi:hypothetical protein
MVGTDRQAVRLAVSGRFGAPQRSRTTKATSLFLRLET